MFKRNSSLDASLIFIINSCYGHAFATDYNKKNLSNDTYVSGCKPTLEDNRIVFVEGVRGVDAKD